MFIRPIVTARNANDWKCTADPSESPFGMPRSASSAGVASATVQDLGAPVDVAVLVARPMPPRP